MCSWHELFLLSSVWHISRQWWSSEAELNAQRDKASNDGATDTKKVIEITIHSCKHISQGTCKRHRRNLTLRRGWYEQWERGERLLQWRTYKRVGGMGRLKPNLKHQIACMWKLSSNTPKPHAPYNMNKLIHIWTWYAKLNYMGTWTNGLRTCAQKENPLSVVASNTLTRETNSSLKLLVTWMCRVKVSLPRVSLQNGRLQAILYRFEPQIKEYIRVWSLCQ